MPNLKRLAHAGVSVTGRSVIPSVTNVNNSSIVTGTFPEEHGITSNFYYNRATGESQFMESAEFLLRPTIFQRAAKVGMKSALVTSKGKLLTLISRGADVAVAAEEPTPEFVAKVGPRTDMYSPDVNYWSFKAARLLLKESGIDLLYLTTTDYMMHTFPPEDERSLAHLATIDRLLGGIVDDHPNLELYLSADHGMNAKQEAVDLGRVLAAKSIDAEAIPIIKDKHKVHHRELGGSCYIFLKDRALEEKAAGILRGTKGVSEVFNNRTAAAEFHLMASRIGDLFVLGDKGTAFGSLAQDRVDLTKTSLVPGSPQLRTHGSRHEATVPVVAYGRKLKPSRYQWNLDITRQLELA